MKNPASQLSKVVHAPYFPLVLILIANLITGLFTFQDYGTSWDEPLFYAYGDAVPYAYSISARLSGNFDIEQAYGPSAEDHKIYGPIYLLLAKPLVDLLDWMLPVPRIDLWHLVNFITLQLGVVLLFALCRRWMNSWAAFGATILYSTQPLIWGHSWINPKDIPFTVFFLATVYFGFKMVDALTEPVIAEGVNIQSEIKLNQRKYQAWKRVIQVLAVIFSLFALLSILFSTQLQAVLGNLIRTSYQSPAGSLLGEVFAALAANAQTIGVEAYIYKGLILFSRLRIILIALGVVFLIPALLVTIWDAAVRRTLEKLVNILAPLPARPAWGWKQLASWGVLAKTLLAGILLGLLVSIRVVGPLAGVLVILYFFLKYERHSFAGIIVYAVTALLAMYFAWPYLWQAPVANFVDVLKHMSHNPKVLPVLFNGTVFPSDTLPVTYLPVMLGITLTLPVWPMFISGIVISGLKIKARLVDWRSLVPILLWFMLPFLYVLVLRPPMYDGYRHFLFILPSVFIFTGLVFQLLGDYLKKSWGFVLIFIVLITPGLIGLVKLHPYEYTYYNLLVGGTGGAFRRYETDFWLTCYKELLPQVNDAAASGTTLFVHRQPSIAREYASPTLTIERFDPDDDRTFPGSLLLLTTRANVDLSIHADAPELLSVGREGATFCLVKEIP